MDSQDFSKSLAPIEHIERHYNSQSYVLPSDEEEAKRLHFQHGLIRKTFDDRIVMVPLELTSGAEVLDIGTGKGAWALDFVATYPNADKANILCIDIGTRLFPQHPPPNVTFQVGDILKQDTHEWADRFAFVHQRLLLGAFKSEQWDDVVGKIYSITAPGGWAQLTEANLLSHFSDCGPATARSLELYRMLGTAAGLDFLCSLRLGDLMRKAGFIGVEVILRVCPLGRSHGEMGTKSAENIKGVFRGLKSPILRLGGFGLVRDEEDYDHLMDEMELEWDNPGCEVGWYVAVGRKAPPPKPTSS